MTEVIVHSLCGRCGAAAGLDVDSATQWRCASCGSERRAHCICVTEAIRIGGDTSGTIRDAEHKRPRVEFFERRDLHRATGRWNLRRRLIDRRRDRYREVIIDPETGQIVHECEQALSEHVGHGSAKNALPARKADS